MTSPGTDILHDNDVLFIDMLFGSDFSDDAIVEDVSKLDLSGEVIPETDILLDNDFITDDIILLADDVIKGDVTLLGNDVITYDIILLDNDVITDGFHVDLNDDVFVGFTVSKGFIGNVDDVLSIDILFGSDFSDDAIVEDVSKLDLSGEVIPETDILLDNDFITDDIILLADDVIKGDVTLLGNDVITYDIILLDNDVITDGFHVDLNDDVFVGFTVSEGFLGNVDDVLSIDILFGSDFSDDAIVEDVSRRDVGGEVDTYDVIVWDDLGVVVEDNGGLGFFDNTLVGRDMEVIFVLSVAVADPLVVAAFVDTPCAVDCFV